MFGQIGEEDGQVETDFFGRLVEPISEADVVDFTVVVRLTACKHKLDFFPKIEEKTQDMQISMINSKISEIHGIQTTNY